MIYVEIWYDDVPPQHPMIQLVDRLKQSLIGDFAPKTTESIHSPEYMQQILRQRQRNYPITYTQSVKFIIWFCANKELDSILQKHIQTLITDVPKVVLVIFANQQDPNTAQFLSALPRVTYWDVDWKVDDNFLNHVNAINDMLNRAENDPHSFLHQYLSPPAISPTSSVTLPSSPLVSDVSPISPTSDRQQSFLPPLDSTDKNANFNRTFLQSKGTLVRKPISDKIKKRPANFVYTPAPKDDPYYYDENISDQMLGVKIGASQWAIAGASRRGNSHQHNGTPRDDAMYFNVVGPWHIIAIADGAGSARLSRVTANLSVERACQVISQFAKDANLRDNDYTKNLMHRALRHALYEIHDLQTQFTNQNHLDKRDTYCTLLILIHQPLPNGGCVFATVQVGDGYMMGMSDERANRIAKGDHGAETGTSYFVLSFTKEQLVERITTYATDKHIHTFMLVTDGIEDDLKVSHEEYQRGRTIDDRAKQFATGLRHLLVRYPLEHWGWLLFKEICYEVVGSNDDRTIVMLLPLPEQQPPFYG
jgi:serine/threonine protein phosphatase PrpC